MDLGFLWVYIEFNKENIQQAVAMIIGPKDSVYSNGVLFFKTTFFQNDYPYSPPKVSYISRGSNRIHPNLYTGYAKDNYLGKVCLSIYWEHGRVHLGQLSWMLVVYLYLFNHY